MTWSSINPATGVVLKTYEVWSPGQLEAILSSSAAASSAWSELSVAARADLLRAAGHTLRARCEESARLMAQEMGKLIGEGRAEVEKCAWVCDYFAEQGPGFLADVVIDTELGHNYVTHLPFGTILTVMPWNFPFWQVFRAAVPALLAGNTVLLKHASNVTGCALAIEDVFRSAGFPDGVFRTLLISAVEVARVIGDPRVHGVTLTGSEEAGRAVAQCAGAQLKKCVLELGGSDAFVVLEDADLDWTVSQAVASRFQNAGQSCIAAKRMIAVEPIANAFVERLKAAVAKLEPGDPLDERTTLAPLARLDLRETLQRQVSESLNSGAVAVAGCKPHPGAGFYYPASILDRVTPGMPAFDAELFGPVASVIRARDEAEALRLANLSRYGLGGSVWTSDLERGERFARRLQCGVAFVNGMVKSDPRLPFGGVKASGFGRELSRHGLMEFVNVKSVCFRTKPKESP